MSGERNGAKASEAQPAYHRRHQSHRHLPEPHVELEAASADVAMAGVASVEVAAALGLVDVEKPMVAVVGAAAEGGDPAKAAEVASTLRIR